MKCQSLTAEMARAGHFTRRNSVTSSITDSLLRIRLPPWRLSMGNLQRFFNKRKEHSCGWVIWQAEVVVEL